MNKLNIPFKYSKNKKSTLVAVIAVVVIIAVCLSVFFCFRKIKAVDTVKLSEVTKAEDINLIGHRGLSSQAPENTISAIELAAEKGIKAVSFDVQLTKDNVWVLCRDEKLNRMTDGKGKISKYTYYDLFDFSIDNGANYKNYDKLNIPSLDDALACCLENELEPIIEIKACNESALKKLVESITDHGFEDSCKIISSDIEALSKIKSINETIKLVYSVSKLDEEQLALCLEHPDFGVCFNDDTKHNDSSKISELLKNDISLYCLTEDDTENIKYYYDAGVKNFITNRIIP